ncbi:hypothetical protein AC482_02100 [miscellaneous Crenarchaeota group-15 archaeon DG-45]|uniref:IPT/TIG domain-containing protein n=1 Tax=miscellaneous Crenarchaeota group-15 archaeon DG-45 TaxID=1685127 RepID=A0A0M0BR56_9ARCH|nr:MAG: hypothetical protein AC482_02100 [miscellaneous Crenarchaeota group-15 archaeon DG-45]
MMLMLASLAQPASAQMAMPPPAQGIYVGGTSPWRGAPGMEVRVYGGGATSDGAVVVLLDGSLGNITLGRTVADAEGNWEITFTVPDISPGYYTVLVVDDEASSIALSGFEVFEVQIRIYYLEPPSGPPGAFVALSGDGATPLGEVRVYLDGASVANLTATDWGSWDTQRMGLPLFQVPDVEPGDYAITALDVTSNTTDTRMFTVTPPPTIHVSPQEASIGSKVTVSGESFTPWYGINLIFEDQILLVSISADENGGFNSTFFVPVVNSGNYTVSALGMFMGRLANASFRVTVGQDTLIDEMKDVQRALNQTQAAAQSASQAASAAEDRAARAESMAGEARTYALAAMIFAVIAAAASVAMLLRKRG